MSPKDCAYIVERLAIRFMAMVADHERQLAEHRTSFGARTEADAKIIAGLRAEIKQRAKEQDQDHKTIVSLISERDGLRVQVQDMREEIIRVNEAHGRTKVVHDGLLDELAVQRDAFTANVERIRCEGRDALRAEVAALQERLRASIARGDFAQMEVAALKSQTPQHPVKVGEWVRSVHGEIARVAKVGASRYELFAPGLKCWTIWHFDYCEPCDPPLTAPVPKRAHPVAVGGYLRRLTGFNTTPAGEIARVTLVEYDDPLVYEVARPNGQTGRWSAKYCEPCDPPPANHDTEAGKAAAESGLLLNGGLDVRKVTT